jgi:predicted glycosyltransferase involved in capsule biosynthesis
MKKKFRSLELVAKKYLDGFSSGLHSTFLKDSLIEVDVVREYQPGDKRLDSKSSLKTGKCMSRVFNPERSLNLFIVLDISSSQYTKLEASIITALYLCYLGDMCNERVGLCVFSNQVMNVTDITDDYSSVIGLIEKSFNGLKMNSTTCVEDSIKRVSNLFLTNSLVVFISDFCYPVTDNFLKHIKKIALTPTNAFLNVVVYNPVDWLMSLNQSFTINFKDAETGSTGSYNAESAKIEFDNWSKGLKSKFLRSSSDVVFLDVKQENFLLPLIKHLMRSQ